MLFSCQIVLVAHLLKVGLAITFIGVGVGFRSHSVVLKTFGHLSFLVQGDDFFHLVDGNSHYIAFVVGIGIPHDAFEDVVFLVYGIAAFEFQDDVGVREALQGFHIGFVFEVEAAFQFATLAGQLLWVGGELLHTGHSGRHGLEVGYP